MDSKREGISGTINALIDVIVIIAFSLESGIRFERGTMSQLIERQLEQYSSDLSGTEQEQALLFIKNEIENRIEIRAKGT